MRILDPIRDRGRRNPGRVTRAARELGQPGLAQRDVEGSHADPALEVCRVFRRAPRDLEGLATRAGPSVHRLGQHRREGFGPGGLHGGPALPLDRPGDRFSRLLMHHLPTPTRPHRQQERQHTRHPDAEHSPPQSPRLPSHSHTPPIPPSFPSNPVHPLGPASICSVHPPPTPVLAPVHVLVLVLVLDPARLPCREAYSVLVLVLDPATRPYREGRPVLILDPVRWPCREGPLVSIPPHGSFPAMICSRSSGRVNSPSADGAGTWHWRQFARSGCVVRISATAPGPPWQTRQLPRRWRSCGMKGVLPSIALW